MCRRFITLSALICLLALPALAHPGGHGEDGEHAKPAAAKPEAPAMSAEEQAAFEAWQKTKSPNEHHAFLEPTVGVFDVKMSHWMAPGEPPMTSTAISRNKWVLGGRYVEQQFEGTFMGEPFVGVGYTGHDNVLGKYVGSWMDNMATGIMTSVGEKTGPGTLTFTAVASDPGTGKASTYRNVVTVKSKDEHSFEMFGAGPDGKEMRVMEVVYTRKK